MKTNKTTKNNDDGKQRKAERDIDRQNTDKEQQKKQKEILDYRQREKSARLQEIHKSDSKYTERVT